MSHQFRLSLLWFKNTVIYFGISVPLDVDCCSEVSNLELEFSQNCIYIMESKPPLLPPTKIVPTLIRLLC